MKRFLTFGLFTILFFNFTSQATSPPNKTATQSQIKGAVKVKALVLFKNGDVKPVPKMEFYLTTKSPSALRAKYDKYYSDIQKAESEKKEEIKQPDFANIPATDRLKIYMAALNYEPPAKQENYDEDDEINPLIQSLKKTTEEVFDSSVATCKTDWTGNCNFLSIKPGLYYLTNIASQSYGNGLVFWDVPVKVLAGKTKFVELSNENMGRR